MKRKILHIFEARALLLNDIEFVALDQPEYVISYLQTKTIFQLYLLQTFIFI